MRSISEIRLQVNDFLQTKNINSVPVDVFELIEECGIKVIKDEMEDDHSGFLLVENGKATVAINSKHHPNRQRFTAAHELGHFFLHAQGEDKLFVDKAFNRNSTSSSGAEVLEIEANRFAAELLMPDFLVREKVGDRVISDLDVYQLAIDFKVSEQAMTLRLVNLRLIDN